MPMPSVAAIVLNYNGKDLTFETIESLRGLTHAEVEIVVVDNGSSDGSHAAVEAAYPEVTALRVEVNQGISVGLNAGIAHAMERGFDYLLLLNNDIEVHPEMVSEMLAVAQSNAAIGCVGPKTYYYADRQRLWSAGGIIQFRESVTRERGMRELDRGQYDRDEEMDYINGCAMLVPRRVVETIGLWDPAYLVGVEDADWCMRMKEAGFQCWYAHKALLWHMVSPTTGGYKPGRTFNTGRSTAIFVRRFAGPLQKLSFWVALLLAIPAAFLRELPKGNQGAAIAKLRGVLDGWKAPLGPPPGWPASPAAEERVES